MRPPQAGPAKAARVGRHAAFLTGAVSGKSSAMALGRAFRGTETVDVGRGPVSVECSQQDRLEGAGVRSGAVSRRAAEARAGRALCPAGHRHGCDRCRGHGSAGALRGAPGRRSAASVFRRHIDVLSRGWRIPEDRLRRTHHGHRLHPRAHRHRQRGRLCRARAFLPDVGAGAVPAFRDEARARLRAMREAAA